MSLDDPAGAHVEVNPAAADREPVLANLLELYTHDFSEFLDLQLQPDGRFGYPPLPLYWREAHRFRFIVEVNGRPAGFVLVKRDSLADHDREVWDVAEFFIVRGLRRRGIGEAAAHQVWRRFQGDWQVRVRDSNRPALAFWRRAVSAFIQSPARSEAVESGDERWQVFSFRSPHEKHLDGHADER